MAAVTEVRERKERERRQAELINFQRKVKGRVREREKARQHQMVDGSSQSEIKVVERARAVERSRLQKMVC